MKKIPKFWKIYIFAVTVTVLLCCIGLFILGGFLRSYEQTAQQNAKEAEELRLYEEKENAERQSNSIVSDRLKLMSVLKEAELAAAVYADGSAGLSVEDFMDGLVASLNESGISAVSDLLDCKIGKYEDPASVTKYIDSLPGEYSYERISPYEYSLKKEGLDAKVTLDTAVNAENGHKTYRASSVAVSLPLMSCRVSTPAGATLKVNGITVDDKPANEKQVLPETVPFSFEVPAVSLYVLEGFVYVPELKAYAGDEECIRVIRDDRTAFVDPATEKYKAALTDRLCTLAFAYSDYVAGDIGFGSIKPYLYKNTIFYDGLASFDTRWYYGYSSLKNVNANITDFYVYSDRLIYAHIEFDQDLYSGSRVYKTVKIELDMYVGCTSTPKFADTDAWLLISAGTKS